MKAGEKGGGDQKGDGTGPNDGGMTNQQVRVGISGGETRRGTKKQVCQDKAEGAISW